jgi:hypothetical protein
VCWLFGGLLLKTWWAFYECFALKREQAPSPRKAVLRGFTPPNTQVEFDAALKVFGGPSEFAEVQEALIQAEAQQGVRFIPRRH